VKGLFIALLLVAAVVIGLGFYRGWWSIASDKSGTKVHLNVTVDKDKVEADKKSVAGTVEDLGREVKDTAPASTR
jgi:hypothetical protein